MDKRGGRAPIIAVIGASSADETARAVARAVGYAIGARGWHLLTGGGGGAMAAASAGHREGRSGAAAPGVAIGVLPGDDARDANPHVDISIPTGMGLSRNAVVARAALGVVAVGGCSGTLSEIALAWQFGRPIAAMVRAGGWGAELAGRCVDNRVSRPVFAAETPEEALLFLEREMGRWFFDVGPAGNGATGD